MGPKKVAIYHAQTNKNLDMYKQDLRLKIKELFLPFHPVFTMPHPSLFGPDLLALLKEKET